MNFTHRFLSPIPKLFRRRQTETFVEIVVEQDGFRVSENGILGDRWLWTDQEEIVARRDTSTMSENIEMAFIVPGDDDYYYLNETVSGFGELTASMEDNLPGFDKSWRDKLLQADPMSGGIIIYEKREATE